MPNGLRASSAGFPSATATQSEAGWALEHWVFAALLALELLAFSLTPLDSIAHRLSDWAAFLVKRQRDLLAAAALMAATTVVLSWPALCAELKRENRSRTYRVQRYAWLLAHLLAVAGVAIWAEVRARAVAGSAASADVWLITGGLLVATASVCWGLAFASADFWSRWLRRSPGTFVLGAVVGFLGRVAGHYVREIPPLKTQTLFASAFILRLFGQDVVVDPARVAVGTHSFTAIVGVTCSGIEGVGLMLVFTAGYLWFCRRELRFPHALILVPIGAVIVWFLNSVRIAALVLLGTWSTSIALHAFHSLAGWALFTGTALGLVAVSRRTPLWTGARAAPNGLRAARAADPYLVPFLVTLAARMITAAFFPTFDFGYPFQAAAAAITLWCYRERLRTLEWRFSGAAIGLGVIVAVLWAGFDRTAVAGAADKAFSAGLRSMSSTTASTWLAFRIAGFLVIAPIVEELAFRGYLLRKLVADEFERVPFNRFTLASFLISSLAFGLLHQGWLVATIAGMIFALAMYRRGRLSDAIGAHAAANGALVAYACVTGHWSVLG